MAISVYRHQIIPSTPALFFIIGGFVASLVAFVVVSSLTDSEDELEVDSVTAGRL